MSPCSKCEAKCCRYFALQIDTPRSKEDFENIRWYLTHQDVSIYVNKKKWYLDVDNKCRYLSSGHRCGIYDKRPLVCRKHSVSACERLNEDFGHELIFKNIEELDRYLVKRFHRGKRSNLK